MATPDAPPPRDEEGLGNGRNGRNGFPIVGIGASAGGLEAASQLLAALPESTGLAYVLVQHLDPHHRSQLTELLGRVTSLPVVDATDGVSVEPDRVYVIPPDAYLSIEQGVLQLTPRGEERAPLHAIDHFFRSLASDRGPRAIAVVLSGTGSDGTLGLAEIKAVGGITFAQEQHSARHPSMPLNAIQSGAVDFVLPPEQIAARLTEIGSHPYLADPDLEAGDKEQFRRILRTIRGVSGVDFEQYRDSTIKRRIARRMALHGITELQRYAEFLTTDRSEVESLYRDVLINVTSFFRDPALFALLKERVFPEIVRSKSPPQPVRIWVPGCSTGQEAYSIAIALLEFFDEQHERRPVQVFATDLSEPTALDQARAGIYPETIEADVTPERLRRFFRKEDHGYRIDKGIREMCVFARQNLVADPPFSHLDLVSCRNVLIYMSPALQKEVMPIFHYALAPSGFLVLGSSETIGQNADLFDLVDRTQRIYRVRAASTRLPLYLGSPPILRTHSERAATTRATASTQASYLKEADRLVVNRYVPPGVLVNDDFEVLQFRGETGAYLQPPSGEPSLSLLKMAREGLFVTLRGSLLEAKRTGKTVVRDDVRVVDGSNLRPITLRIQPVRPPDSDHDCYLVLFEPSSPIAASASTGEDPAPVAASGRRRRGVGKTPRRGGTDDAETAHQLVVSEQEELARLRHEFAATREYLQSLTEQQDASNEELRSANEEILSSNEELQSTNEELETAKEELQSANEELTTVNEQLQKRNLELSVTGNDLSNLLSSTGLPVVMVGSDLRIRRLTPAARKVLNLLPADVGRSIGEIRPSLRIEALDPLIGAVIEDVKAFEREVQDESGAWWLLRIVPYRTSDNRIDGAVVILIDVDALKRSQSEAREARDYSAAVVQTTHEPLLVLDPELRVVSVNPAFVEKFGVAAADIEQHSIYEMAGGRWDIPPLRELLAGVTAQRRNVEDVAIDYQLDGLGRRALLFNARWIEQASEPLILLAIEDITERKEKLDSLAAAVKRRDEFLAMLSHELRNPLAAIDATTRLLRRSADESLPIEKSLEVLDRQVHQLRRLVEDLLDVSRLVHGKVTLRTEPVDLNRALEAAIEAAHSQADSRAQALELALPAEPLWVEADPVRLDQILHNLLSNAIKFTDRAGRIQVSLAGTGGDGAAQAEIAVRDDGNGIPPEVLSHVFEQFVQGANADGDHRAGLGMGLALVKQLAELHGGSVEARNLAERHGAEVVVRLPAIESRESDADSTGDDGPAQRASGSRHILLVEDNADAAQTMATLLSMMGHDVRTVPDGPSALAALEEDVPEVAIVDVGLPGMSGYDLARSIRDLPKAAGVVLIAHTGYAQDADRERAREAGFDHHLVKPVDWEALERLLDGGGREGGGDWTRLTHV